MEMVKLTIRLPKQLHQTLQERAAQSAQSLNRVIVDTLRRGVEREEAKPLSEYERTMAAIRKTGLVTTLGPEWDKYIEDAPDMTVEELREALRGISPLSEDIIADRGER
jgi:predicted transcriptional regulator